jgi:hypothetical protein
MPYFAHVLSSIFDEMFDYAYLLEANHGSDRVQYVALIENTI